jgi:hypothetical protein
VFDGEERFLWRGRNFIGWWMCSLVFKIFYASIDWRVACGVW